MLSLIRKLTFISICIFFSPIVFSSPVLIFDSSKVFLLGADNVILNDHFYNVRFTRQPATIFENQASADLASKALIDQVFETDAFRLINFCNDSLGCHDGVSIWFGEQRAGGSFVGSNQYWGEIITVPNCIPRPGRNCKYEMNRSNVRFSKNGSYIVNEIAYAPWLIACGDCGYSGSVWTKVASVSEPSSTILLVIAFTGLVIMRLRHFWDSNIISRV